MSFAYAPTQAAEFSGPGRRAMVVYTPEWSETVLAVLESKPDAYEAAWSFQESQRAHVLQVNYSTGPEIRIALIDGIHNAVLARLAAGAALVLSPYPLYRESPEQEAKLFDPDQSLALPTLPNPLDQ